MTSLQLTSIYMAINRHAKMMPPQLDISLPNLHIQYHRKI